MDRGITLVKGTLVSAGAASIGNAEIDLDLAIDEAARIMGVLVTGDLSGGLASGTTEVAIGFDPEATQVAGAVDNQFFSARCSVGFDTSGAAYRAVTVWADFSNQMLITTRNLSMMVDTAAGMNGSWTCKLFYEKYKPAQNELVQLIAHRR